MICYNKTDKFYKMNGGGNMEYRRFGDKIVLRIDRGEEVVETIVKLCEIEKIALASVNGIGAADHVLMGLYDVGLQQFNSTELNCPLEITALAGNITKMNGNVYQHLHITVADAKGNAYGGHLKQAWISGTAEVILDLISGEVDRALDSITGTGLNLLKF